MEKKKFDWHRDSLANRTAGASDRSYFSAKHDLESMHRYLMYKEFPYHSVSVIHRAQDLGLHVIFMEGVKDMVTDEIKGHIKSMGFTFSFVSPYNK